MRLLVRRRYLRIAGQKTEEKTQKMIEISKTLCYNMSVIAKNAVSNQIQEEK